MKRMKLQAGSNLVEFALVLPLLLILVFGIIDFSLALYDKSVVTNASREGARAGVVTKVPPPTDADIQAVVNTYCNQRLISFGGSASPTVVINRSGGTSTGDPLGVTVSYSYSSVALSKLIPSLGSMNLNATTVMRLE